MPGMNTCTLMTFALLCLMVTVSISMTREQDRVVGKTSTDMLRMMDYKDTNKVGIKSERILLLCIYILYRRGLWEG